MVTIGSLFSFLLGHMKLLSYRFGFLLEFLISGPYIALYYFYYYYRPELLMANLTEYQWQTSLDVLALMIPLVITFSLIAQWSYFGTLENLFRRATFTIIVLLPLYMVWGDLQFTFWLSSVHLLSSVLTLYERNTQQKDDFRFAGSSWSGFTSFGLSPSQIVLFSFLLLIIIGTTLLLLPIATKKDMALIDHLFVITSAACVTGLSPVNLAECYTFFGQMVILLVIQVGGLGIMTLSASFVMFLGKEMNVKDRLLMQDILEVNDQERLSSLIIDILKLTFFFEIIGSAFLAFSFWQEGFTASDALYIGIFHSISAFCNAGMSILPRGLEDYPQHLLINFTITSLIILGGIGFWVLKDVGRVYRSAHRKRQMFRSLSLHSKTVLVTTGLLLLVGTALIFISEFMTTLAPYPLGDKLMISYFWSVTSRTAGYNTIPTGLLGQETLFFIILLMFIGASPGSTGGGIKTSTFAVLWQSVKATLTGRGEVVLFKRVIDESIVVKASALSFLSIAVVSFFTYFLILVEPKLPFLGLFFEAVSAFGTVGLSVGLTGSLSFWGKMIIITLMYIGRVGPLTMVLALASRKNSISLKYPKEKVMIG